MSIFLQIKKLETAKKWILRQLLQIPWIARVTNTNCLEKSNERTTLCTTVRKGQTVLFDHAVGREVLKNMMMTGQISRRRGRLREVMLGV